MHNCNKVELPGPAFYSSKMKMWIISKYDDVINLLKDQNKFQTVSDYKHVFEQLALCPEAISIMNDIVPLNTARMANTSAETHTRLRDAIKKCFVNSELVKFNAKIVQIINNLLDEFKSKSEFDLINDFAKHISLRSILTLLGVPSKDFELIRHLHSDISRLFLTKLPKQEQIIAAQSLRNLKFYLNKLIDQKKYLPQDDVISYLTSTQKELNKAEIIQLLFDIISAGFDTTLNAMSWTFYHLLKSTITWNNLPTDTLLNNYIDESLRLNMSQMGLVRLSKEEIMLNNVTIPKNSMLYILHIYANRDSEYFANASTFIPERKSSCQHLTFGYGIHYCLGARLAKNEILLAVKALHSRYSKLSIQNNNEFFKIHDTGMMKIIDKMIVKTEEAL